jgi:hypothetical protein
LAKQNAKNSLAKAEGFYLFNKPQSSLVKTLSHIILLYFYKINKIGYYSIFFWEIAGDSGAFGDDGRHAPTTCY